MKNTEYKVNLEISVQLKVLFYSEFFTFPIRSTFKIILLFNER